MGSILEVLVGLASTVTRLSAFCFLRWIPGHHLPPVIVAATTLYLSLIIANPSRFGGTGRPSLREAFPKLLKDDHGERTKSKEVVQESQDEPALYEDERTVLKILALGIPNWHEWEFSYITVGLNVLVMLLSLDFVFRGPLLHDSKDLRFARLGYIDDKSAKVLIREPNAAALPIYVYLRPSSETSWSTVDNIYRIGEETDYTYPIVFENLQPDTSYTYTLSNDLKGSFTTTPAANSEKARSLTFLTSSCIKANFPYNPFSHSLSIHGFKFMSKALQALPRPASFMLFLGDFIYVDVPYRLSSSQEHYRSEYRRVYASPSWKLPGVSLPWIHTLDDHEIANDWTGGNRTEPFPAASDPFMHYHVSVNPPVPPTASTGPDANTTFFQFTQGPASFFMMDTRRYRTRPETAQPKTASAKPLYGTPSSLSQEPDQEPTMLGSVQLQALLAFLQKPERPNVQWKILATSVPFTKNWRFGTSDTWGGFLTERSKILEAMHFAEDNLGVRVVILSGDRHEFAAIRYPPKKVINPASEEATYDNMHNTGPHEFSVGPLSMFYLPFRTFKQIDTEDVALAYFPDGNSKLGAISITPAITSDGTKRSRLTYSLFIDGKVSWTYDLSSPAPDTQRRTNLQTWKKLWS